MNILYVVIPCFNEKEVIEAAKASYAHSFIKRLPKGYDTMIQEDGGGLSQGQKQLLCIARVMLCLPPMLILDEATSSIDTRTEIKIQKAFAKMMEGKKDKTEDEKIMAEMIGKSYDISDRKYIEPMVEYLKAD